MTAPVSEKRPPRKKRRRSPRPSKTGGRVKHPNASAHFKALWADPVWREKTLAAHRVANARRKLEPHKNYRRGVPDGMRKAEADALWAKARARAEELHQIMVVNGEAVPIVTETVDVEIHDDAGNVVNTVPVQVPVSDEAKGSAALREAFVMLMCPVGRHQDRLAAARTVLEYTKPKPATKQDIRLNNAEAWLEQVVQDTIEDDGDTGATP